MNFVSSLVCFFGSCLLQEDFIRKVESWGNMLLESLAAFKYSCWARLKILVLKPMSERSGGLTFRKLGLLL